MKILPIVNLTRYVIYWLSLTSLTIAHGSPSGQKGLLGHVPQAVKTAKKIGPVESNKLIDFTVALEWNNPKELDHFLKELNDPASPSYKKYLEQEEFQARFAPTENQLESVKNFLNSNNLKVKSVASNHILVQASGTSEAISRAFHTEISYFTTPMGLSFFAPNYELQVPKELPIQAVHGLENLTKLRHYHIKNESPFNHTLVGTGPNNGLSPANIRKAYSIPANLTGSGQTLALFELDGYTQADVAAYETNFQLPQVTPQNILMDGVTGTPSAGNGPAEVTLDIELMIAMAPGISGILVYEGPNSASGVVDTYNQIAIDNKAKAISTSWGTSESNMGSAVQTEANIFKQMVAQGQVLYAAAGDSGAYDDGANLSVDDPASDPFVVAVGGTTLTTNVDGSYLKESTWKSGDSPGNSGGGGGISTAWPIPTWQKGIVSQESKGSTTMRNVPDVSLNADPATGYAIYVGGSWNVYGGTSCAAPLWAAFTALVNQNRLSQGAGVIGFPNPDFAKIGPTRLYSSSFHDINDGSTNLFYPALFGYDDATGWGTINGSLIDNLTSNNEPGCAHAAPSLTITSSQLPNIESKTNSYSLSVTNNDSSGCSSTLISLKSTLPANFIGQFSAPYLILAPGTSGSDQFAVTSQNTLANEGTAIAVTATISVEPALGTSESITFHQ